jgi:hypothetical protein
MKRIERFRERIFARIHPAVIAMSIVILSLMSMLAWSPASPTAGQAETPIPAVTETSELTISQPTPIPQEWVDNIEQTNGIIVGAVILAIIIIGGTLHTISQNKEQQS